MTELEILDSAVKIGLGALISAAATLSVVGIQANIERNKDKRTRKLAVIQQAGGDFEKCHTVFIKLYSSYAIFLKYQDLGNAAGVVTWDSVLKSFEPVNETLLALHTIEASLLLIGAGDSVDALVKYRLNATTLQSEAVRKHTDETPMPTPDRWDHLSARLQESRRHVFSHLRKNFEAV